MDTQEAKIISILEEKEVEMMDKTQLYQKLKLEITKGENKGETITVESGQMALVNLPQYKTGDKVIVTQGQNPKGESTYYITDYIRRGPLLSLFIIFVFLTALIARKKGLTALLGMLISFLVIFFFILPNILTGADPIQTAIFGSILIIPPSFFLSHGFNKKTLVAMGGTIISLMITAVLAGVFVQLSRLSGFASEEAGFLQLARPGNINIQGLLLAGIIIGSLGVLDDITISQSAIVQELKKTDAKLKSRQLYQKSMSVGKDHITSMVNTLILVYTGASLPLLLLFVDNPHPFLEVINYEVVADEIVRTLVGSIGLVLAVPITTFLACSFLQSKD